MKAQTKPNGAVLYRGPSLLDGKPIIAIVTGLADSSANAKTGAMLQTWILREDIAPLDAVKSGADASICGDCRHRPFNGGACYVRVSNAPRAVWSAFHRGRYADASGHVNGLSAIGRGRAVRIGSYGDPAAVPAEVWTALIAGATMHTGYTHQWRGGAGSASALRGVVMASADSAEEMAAARADGWRTFRVRDASEALQARESVCPASAEAGHKVDCATCGACNGAASGRKGSVAIVVHGAMAVRYTKQNAALAVR